MNPRRLARLLLASIEAWACCACSPPPRPWSIATAVEAIKLGAGAKRLSTALLGVGIAGLALAALLSQTGTDGTPRFFRRPGYLFDRHNGPGECNDRQNRQQGEQMAQGAFGFHRCYSPDRFGWLKT